MNRTRSAQQEVGIWLAKAVVIGVLSYDVLLKAVAGSHLALACFAMFAAYFYVTASVTRRQIEHNFQYISASRRGHLTRLSIDFNKEKLAEHLSTPEWRRVSGVVMSSAVLSDEDKDRWLRDYDLERPITFSLISDAWSGGLLVFSSVNTSPSSHLLAHVLINRIDDSSSIRKSIRLSIDKEDGSLVADYIGNGEYPRVLLRFPFLWISEYLTKLADERMFATISKLPSEIDEILTRHKFSLANHVGSDWTKFEAWGTEFAEMRQEWLSSPPLSLFQQTCVFCSEIATVSVSVTPFAPAETLEVMYPPFHAINWSWLSRFANGVNSELARRIRGLNESDLVDRTRGSTAA